MPNLQGQASTFRAGNYGFTGYLATLSQTVVLNRAVNMATITYPVTAITYDNAYSGGGSFSNVREGMTIVVFSQNTTTIKGILRVAAGGATSTVIQVNEFSAGTLSLADNDRFEVRDTYCIWDKLAAATTALNKDSRVAVSDNPANPPPIANAGGLWVSFVDAGQSYATVTFDASVSLRVDPDSGSLSYSWNVVDGTITVGSGTSAAITVRFPVGERHVILSVTDSGASKTTTRALLVKVYDSNTMPLAVAMQRLEYSKDDGWSASFELPRGAQSDITTLPDGSLVVYFEQESYGASITSYGSNVSGRSHIKFVGYLVRESIRIEPEDNSVTFEAIGPLGILNKTPALPQIMINSSSNARWRNVKTLTVNRALWYLIWWHSTALGYFDFIWSDGTSFAYSRLAETDTSSIAAQIRSIAKSINVELTCDRLGRILLIRDPNYLSSADRSARTTTYQFTTADILSLDMTREHRGMVKTVRGSGLLAGTTVASNRPVKSNAPGKAPGPFGTGTDNLDKQIVTNQTDMNTRTGFHFARVNGFYNGLPVPQNTRVELPDGYDVLDPAHMEFITLTLASTTNRRGIAFTTSTRWIIESMSIAYDMESGAKTVSATISHETFGPAGTTFTEKQKAANGLPAVTPPEIVWPPIIIDTIPTIPPPFTSGQDNAVVLLANGNFYTTTDFSTPEWAGGPTWTSASSGLSGTPIQWAIDPFSPRFTIGSGAVNGWIITTTGVYTVADIFGARTVTLRYTFPSSSSLRTLAIARHPRNLNMANFVLVVSNYLASGGVVVSRSTNGTTFSDVTVTSNYNTDTTSLIRGNNMPPGLSVSSSILGRAYVGAYTATASGPTATSEIYQTSDYGATWSATGIVSRQWNFPGLHVPTHNNTSDRFKYWTDVDTSTTITQARSNNTTITIIDPVPGSGTAKAAAARANGIASHPLNSNLMVAVMMRAESSVFRHYVYISYNRGDTWVECAGIPSSATIGARWLTVQWAANKQDTFWLLGENGSLLETSDLGVTVNRKDGNLPNSSVIGFVTV